MKQFSTLIFMTFIGKTKHTWYKTEPFLCATVDKVHNINRRSSRDNQTYNFQFLLDQEGEVSCNIIMYALKITILDLLGCYENPVRSIGLIFIYVHLK